jgi:predicted O-linked N-acetylglucosamine transferase (SPINDLY family)
MADHLARYGCADLFLDTFPYNAHTTASDALLAGVPVLTCSGDSFASRVAASLLLALDLPELICADLSDYEAQALILAQHPSRLLELRSRLGQQERTAALFDMDRFRAGLEAAYLTMWRRREAGLEPVSFEVGTDG